MITIKDNYLEDVDHIRDLAVDCTKWSFSTDPNSGFGWRGYRSLNFRQLLSTDLKYLELLELEQGIFDYVWKERNLSSWTYPKYVQDFLANGNMMQPMITSYFHQSPANTVDMLHDFWADRFHRDYFPCAGVIYLNPDPPPNTGTSILDARNNQFINTENVYNRLIAYDGFNIHGLSGCFGDCPETNRLTIVFFIHEKQFPLP